MTVHRSMAMAVALLLVACGRETGVSRDRGSVSTRDEFECRLAGLPPSCTQEQLDVAGHDNRLRLDMVEQCTQAKKVMADANKCLADPACYSAWGAKDQIQQAVHQSWKTQQLNCTGGPRPLDWMENPPIQPLDPTERMCKPGSTRPFFDRELCFRDETSSWR